MYKFEKCHHKQLKWVSACEGKINKTIWIIMRVFTKLFQWISTRLRILKCWGIICLSKHSFQVSNKIPKLTSISDLHTMTSKHTLWKSLFVVPWEYLSSERGLTKSKSFKKIILMLLFCVDLLKKVKMQLKIRRISVKIEIFSSIHLINFNVQS